MDPTSYTPSQGVRNENRLSNIHTVALNELQELESEPLCHRIAARLLVNNCHLLDGQDEATVHMDSGRAARDFVDSYAASLAICDLERGSFVIPPTCSLFREATLAALPISTQPQLHVSTPEIDDCLEGLAQSDSAWNTWVSYRHKTLRFCEAARADNEKTQSIHVYQRVTKILEKLTTQIEDELEERLRSLNRAFHETAGSVDTFATQVNEIKTGLSMVDEVIQGQLHRTAMESSKMVKGGLEDARGLQRILAVLLRTTMDATAEVAAAHEIALETATQNANQEIETLMTVLAATVSSSLSLQNQMEATQIQTGEMIQNQAKLEAGMERLEGLADHLLVKFDKHEGRLEQAQQKTTQILDTLDAATVSASAFRNSFFRGFGFSGLWPYVLFPVASLVMGSYGLEPSIGRNLWLVGVGELIGCVVSSASLYTGIFFPPSRPRQTTLNTTFGANEPADYQSDATNGGYLRFIHTSFQ
ncbi:hypothetical protein BGZ61DRAFT_572420 [Ilyonectria robusta]|uniref:uncharacterized protein n=1 Tax=Ilyonectria robusta TaxID=1079257 RepID=UPI001E8DB419|nr:uncharacterized protein BGZ61DRAFT_572420 [Ilyonectria robusta]KAH8722129.1 hypothetical protein BGZ61DRAFT_572420 [Ilyonectria robusta]